MGICHTFFRSPSTQRIILTGLDTSGKTSILYHNILHVRHRELYPTIGFNVESVKIHGIHLNLWDLGGGDIMHDVFHTYFGGTNGLIFVVDSSDKQRKQDAYDELYNRVINYQQLNGVPLLVFCNKQDLPNSLTPQEIHEALQLDTQRGLREFHVQPCSAKTGDGISEGLRWLVSKIRQQ